MGGSVLLETSKHEGVEVLCEGVGEPSLLFGRELGEGLDEYLVKLGELTPGLVPNPLSSRFVLQVPESAQAVCAVGELDDDGPRPNHELWFVSQFVPVEQLHVLIGVLRQQFDQLIDCCPEATNDFLPRGTAIFHAVMEHCGDEDIEIKNTECHQEVSDLKAVDEVRGHLIRPTPA